MYAPGRNTPDDGETPTPEEAESFALFACKRLRTRVLLEAEVLIEPTERHRRREPHSIRKFALTGEACAGGEQDRGNRTGRQNWDLRRNLKSYLDQVYNDRETLIVTRKNNENVVLILLEEYNNLEESTYLL